jgi:hypothetical protein
MKKHNPIQVLDYAQIINICERDQKKRIRRYGRHVSRENRKARMWRFWNRIFNLF